MGRVLCLTLFTYIFGPGNFWPLMVFIAGHVLLITILQTLFDYLVWKEFSLQSLFDNIFQGISNIYFHNQINQYVNRKSSRKLVKGLELAHHLFIECIIILENTVMLILVILSLDNMVILGLVIGSYLVYLLGLSIKMGFYKFCYIWNDVLWADLKTLKSDLLRVRKHEAVE